VDTDGKGSLENGEIDPGVAKVLGFRLERVLATFKFGLTWLGKI